MNPRSAALGGVAVILLIACGALYYRRSGAPEAPGRTVSLDGICLACREAVATRYSVDEGEPAVCPKCQARAVYGTFYCYDCKLRVVPQLEPGVDGGPPRVPMVPTCPVCRGSHLAGYIAEDPEHHQAKVGPLPPWPGRP